MLQLERKTAESAAIAALTVGLTMCGGAAQAAVITETAPVTGSGFFDPGQDVLVSQFDPALGTLTAASASLTGQLTPGVVFATDFSTLPPLTVTFNPTIAVNGSGQFLPSQSVVAQDIGGGNGRAIGTPDAIDVTIPLSLGNLPINPVFPGALDFYIKAGSVNTTLPPGAFFTADLGTLTAQLAVTYTYTPGAAVPEPASLALLGVGLVGLCAVRSRERRSASA